MLKMFPSSWSILRDGSKLALRHPWISLAICILGTGLGGLAPLLMVRGGLGDNLAIESLLFFVAVLPLDMYFLPRLVLRLDAETLGHAKNPGNVGDAWKEAFEARWLHAFGAKVLLGIAAGLGILMFILPGFAVLFCFGWAPTRVLLRGESLREACLGSLDLMRRLWPLAVSRVLLVLLIGMTVSGSVQYAIGAYHPLTSPKAELLSPLFWGEQFLGTIVSVWTATSLLALYQKLESFSDEMSLMSSMSSSEK
jgi:hypothetical protein